MAIRSVADPKVDVAVVCALELEAGPLLEQIGRHRKTAAHRFKVQQGILGEHRVVVVQASVRPAQLANACNAVLAVHGPEWVVAAGFACGLNDQARSGDVVVGSEVVSETGESLQTSAVCADLFGRATGMRTGSVVSLSSWPRTVARKRELGERTGATAADLQSFTVGRCCAARDVRFLVIRVLADDINRDASLDSLAVYNPSRSYRVGAMVGAWLSRSGRAQRIWKLRAEAKGYGLRLANFLSQHLRHLDAG